MRVCSLIGRAGLLLAGFVGLSGAAVAQTAPDPPPGIAPVESVKEINGINLTSGQKDFDMPVVLSTPADPRLRFDKAKNAAPYITGIGTPAADSITWSYTIYASAGVSESFKCPQETGCVSTTGSGSRLPTMGNYTRAPGGENYRFDLVHADEVNGTQHFRQKYASNVTYPDGEHIDYTYSTGFVSGMSRTWYRPIKLQSNSGYYITISYQDPGTDASQAGWAQPAEAKLYAPGGTLIRRVTSGPIVSNAPTTVTDYGAGDPIGRAYQTTGTSHDLGGNLETPGGTLQLPTEATNALTLSTLAGYGVIGSVNRDGVTWNYAYSNIGINPLSTGYNYSNVTATGPNNYSMSYAITQGGIHDGYRNILASQTDALGQITSFGYDSVNGFRLTDVTYPEGNHVHMAYDDCANLVSKTTYAKTGSGLPNIVESAAYPSTGDFQNPCPDPTYYRPTSTTDALGRVTTYKWDPATAMLTRKLEPADANGEQRLTYISYAPSTAGIYRKSQVKVCKSSSTDVNLALCVGNADSRTDYTYVGDTNLPASVMVTDEATGATRTTTYTYDAAGRPLSVDGPLSGTDDAKYFRYDLYGRKTWEIGAADGSNPATAKRMAKYFTYRDSDDKVIKVESGTVTCPTNCTTDSLTLTVLETTDLTYDSRRYAIREATTAGGALYRVTDKSFLDRGLADCTTVRMNFAALPAATATGACSLGATGAQGPDRITKNNYDAAGQLTKVQKAYGVTTANGFPATLQQDYVTYTYSNNGKQLTIKDANNNLATYVYDGFDRLAAWKFPSAANGTVSAACNIGTISEVGGQQGVTGPVEARGGSDDCEKYGYDRNGNRRTLVKRDGSVLRYTYDNLNRAIIKDVPTRADLTAAQTRDVYTTYDRMNRPTAIKFDSAAGADGITNAFDGLGQQTSSQISMAGFTKAITSPQADYDAAGRRTKVTHPDGQAFSYSYDARDRLTGIYEGACCASQLDGFAYNTEGRLYWRSETGGNSTFYTWDGIDRLIGQSETFPGGTGNVGWSFDINSASQIVGETRDNDSYAYGGLVAVNRAYTVNGLNQYTAAGAASFTYDLNGNLTGDGTNAYVYDIENRLVKATAAAQVTNLVYDPLGRLFQVTKGSADTRFIYDGDALVAEYNSTGAITNRFVQGTNAKADDPLVWYTGATVGSGNRRYLHADHLGSIVAVTNASGGPSINKYDDYGIPQTDGSGNNINTGRFQYTGQAFIPELGAGMYYYKARMYSAFLGRFLQTDPIGYGDQINLYEYVGDDPINGNDPEGLYECKTPSDCAAAAQGIAQMKEARDFYKSPETGSRIPRSEAAAKAIDKVLGSLGKKGDGGVNIHAQNTLGPKGEMGNYDRSAGPNGTINIYLKQISEAGGRLGETLAHEGQHYRQRNDPYFGRFAAEVRPMMMEYIVGRAPGGSIGGGGWRNYVYGRLTHQPYCPTLSAYCAGPVNQAINAESGKYF